MDNGANMLKSVCDIHCLAHIIHLVVSDALNLGDRSSVCHSAIKEVIEG